MLALVVRVRLKHCGTMSWSVCQRNLWTTWDSDRRPFRFVLHKFTLRSCHSQSHGWDTTVFSLSDQFLGNKSLHKNWSDRENTYTEIQATLDKEGIRLIRMRQGVSSGSDEQVGSSSQSTVTQTNVDKETYFPFTHKSTFLATNGSPDVRLTHTDRSSWQLYLWFCHSPSSLVLPDLHPIQPELYTTHWWHWSTKFECQLSCYLLQRKNLSGLNDPHFFSLDLASSTCHYEHTCMLLSTHMHFLTPYSCTEVNIYQE